MYKAIEKFIDSATPASRCLLAIFASTPYFVLYFLVNLPALVVPEIRAGVRPAVVWAAQGGVVLSIVINGGLGCWLWPHRQSTERFPKIFTGIAINMGLLYTFMALLAGAFTAGPGLVWMGVLAVGLFLFELRTMWIAYLVCASVLVAYDLLVLSGVARYAPAITARAFEGVEVTWWWAIWRDMAFYVGLVAMTVIPLLLFDRLNVLHDKLNQLSGTDVLTGLANRRHFMERLGAEVLRQKRTKRPLSMVMVDADHFKRVNDTYGHAMGDSVLCDLARVLAEGVRTPTDLAVRLGGEEFAILLPETSASEAEAVCRRIHERLSALTFKSGEQSFQLTVSMGGAECLGQDVEAVMKLADRNLYRAKEEGRNRTIFSVSAEVA
ncbi:MAG: GGDEF domain-containing protein [Pseudomonadota bacterium]